MGVGGDDYGTSLFVCMGGMEVQCWFMIVGSVWCVWEGGFLIVGSVCGFLIVVCVWEGGFLQCVW